MTTLTLSQIDDHQFRSHPRADVADALRRGAPVWRLDGPGDGRDVLLGDRDEIEVDVLAYYEIEEWPDGWMLDRVAEADAQG